MAASLVFLAGCQRATTATSSTASTPPTATVAKAARLDFVNEIEIVGAFRPYQEVEVHAKIAGYLREIKVDVGDNVRAGQVLATLDVPELDQEIAQANALAKRVALDVGRAKGDLERAEAMYELRRISYERLKSVSDQRPKLVARQELDNANAQFNEARAQVSAARATLASAEQQIEVARAAVSRTNTMKAYLTITAPFSGVVTRRYSDTGAMVQQGTASQTQARPIVRVTQVDRLRLTIPVPEGAIPSLKTGQTVRIRPNAFDRQLTGRVSRFFGSVDEATRTMSTEIDVPNPGYQLKPGMFASVLLPLDRRDDVVSVPVQAIHRQGGTTVAYVLTDQNKVEERTVTTGMEKGDHVEIVSGITDGDTVVTATGFPLKAGMIVVPKIQTASGAAQ